MNRLTINTVVLACCASGLGLGGCSSSSKTKTDTQTHQTMGYYQPPPSQPTGGTTGYHAGWPKFTSDSTTTWTSMAYPTGDPRTSALGVEKGVPHQVRMNQPFEQTIVVTNLTSLKLNEVVVTDQCGNFKVTSSAPQGQSGTGGQMTWPVGDLGPNESKTIKITGSAIREANVSSCLTASYNSSLCSTVPVVSPKLMITKTGPTGATKCDEITYTYEVVNAGTGTITGVKISDALETGMATTEGKKAAEFNIGNLEPGQKRTVTTRVKVEKGGSFESKATASADGGMFAESSIVSTAVAEPKLAIAIKCPEKTFIGRNMDYEVTVTNTGDVASKDTIVEGVIPSGAQFVSAVEGGKASGGKVLWNVGTLEPKASKTFKATLGAIAPGAFNSTATVRAACATPVSTSCTSQAVGVPAILLEVVDTDDPVQVGANETYVITVTNQGSAADTNIKVVCTLEANQTHLSSQGPTNGSASGSTITFAPLPTLGPKEKATYRVVVKNVKAGDVRFKCVLTSDQLTRQVEETEATRVYD